MGGIGIAPYGGGGIPGCHPCGGGMPGGGMPGVPGGGMPGGGNDGGTPL